MYLENTSTAWVIAFLVFILWFSLNWLDYGSFKKSLDIDDETRKKFSFFYHWQFKIILVIIFAIIYIGFGQDMGRRTLEDTKASYLMFIVGWPLFLIAILMLFPNQKK